MYIIHGNDTASVRVILGVIYLVFAKLAQADGGGEGGNCRQITDYLP